MNIESIKAAVEAARKRERTSLLDCPFCGGQAHYELGEYAVCVNDNCKIAPSAAWCSEHVIDDWNTRPAQEQADAALLALWAEYEKLQAQVPR